MEDGFATPLYQLGDNQYKLKFKQVITAAGGFEADLDWLAEGWGDAAKNFWFAVHLIIEGGVEGVA